MKVRQPLEVLVSTLPCNSKHWPLLHNWAIILPCRGWKREDRQNWRWRGQIKVSCLVGEKYRLKQKKERSNGGYLGRKRGNSWGGINMMLPTSPWRSLLCNIPIDVIYFFVYIRKFERLCSLNPTILPKMLYEGWGRQRGKKINAIKVIKKIIFVFI